MTIQDDIERLTQRIEDTEMLIECCPVDYTYRRTLNVDYDYLLRQRARLIKERDNE